MTVLMPFVLPTVVLPPPIPISEVREATTHVALVVMIAFPSSRTPFGSRDVPVGVNGLDPQFQLPVKPRASTVTLLTFGGALPVGVWPSTSPHAVLILAQMSVPLVAAKASMYDVLAAVPVGTPVL